MIYLASPYTHPDPAVRELRCRAAAFAAGALMRRGMVVYAPIVHGHHVYQVTDLPDDWTFWQKQCLEMLSRASALVMLQMPGSSTSVGMAEEREYAKDNRIPVLAVDADTVVPVELLKEIIEAERAYDERPKIGGSAEPGAAPKGGAVEDGGEPLSRRARGW